MSNRIALLLFSSALLASCGKASVIDISDTDSPTALYVEDSTIQFTDPTLKERYVTIEDSIGFYVEKLDDIEQMYYTSDLGNEEFMQLSITGLGLQEKLTFFLKSSIEENIEKAKRYCEYVVKSCGAIPIAPHIYFTQFLDDSLDAERAFGTFARLQLLSECDELWYFGDSVSKGMVTEIIAAKEQCIPVRYVSDKEINQSMNNDGGIQYVQN
jgi:hypothetical protein